MTKCTLPVQLFAVLCLIAATFLLNAQAMETKEQLIERLGTELQASNLLSNNAKEFVQTNLFPMITDAVLVAEVKAQNAKNMSLDDITGIDNEWKEKNGEVPLHQQLMSNAAAKEISKLTADFPEITECFVMDNQGANVGQFNETSDYWQGDEAKWKNSFNNGKGGVDIGEKEIDKSTALAQQQVSLPIIDESGTVVGAITFGLDVTQL